MRSGIDGGDKPDWLKVSPYAAPQGGGDQADEPRATACSTVCDSSHCPNIGECWGPRQRHLHDPGRASAPVLPFLRRRPWRSRMLVDPGRAGEGGGGGVTDSVLEYVVITSVTRDDLADGGASIFARNGGSHQGRQPRLSGRAAHSGPRGDLRGAADHAPGRTRRPRPQHRGGAVACRRECGTRWRPTRGPWQCCQAAKMVGPEVMTKTSLMLGLGETEEEVHQCLQDLRDAQGGPLDHGPVSSPEAWTSCRWNVTCRRRSSGRLGDGALGLGFRPFCPDRSSVHLIRPRRPTDSTQRRVSVMLVDDFDPLKGKMLEILSKDGNVDKELEPKIDDDTLAPGLPHHGADPGRRRQGGASCSGKAASAPIRPPRGRRPARSVRPWPWDRTIGWSGPSASWGRCSIRGVPLWRLYLYWMGNEEGSSYPEGVHVDAIRRPGRLARSRMPSASPTPPRPEGGHGRGVLSSATGPRPRGTSTRG